MTSMAKKATLSAVFVAAIAAPPAIFMAEANHEAREAAKPQGRISLLQNQYYVACLEKSALPSRGISQALYNWSDRLSFLPPVSRELKLAAMDKGFSSDAATRVCQEELYQLWENTLRDNAPATLRPNQD